MIPVGPAGSGKSTLALALRAQCSSYLRWWQRDAVFAHYRNENFGLAKTRRLVHQDLLRFLRQERQQRDGENDDNHPSNCNHNPPTTTVLVLDSTNGNADARELYVREAAPDRVIFAVFQPPDEENVVENLLQLTENRLLVLGDVHDDDSDGVQPKQQQQQHPSFPDTVEGQRRKHLNILKGMSYPVAAEEIVPGTATTVLKCNPFDGDAREDMPFAVFREFSASTVLNVALERTASKTAIGKRQIQISRC